LPNGSLVLKNGLTPEEQRKLLNEINTVLMYRKSDYYMNQIISDTDENGSNTLVENGLYRFSLSGAGCNLDNHSKFEGHWIKTSTKDELEIKNDFTWNRRKQIDDNYFLLCEGTYTFTENVLIFSLLKSGHKENNEDELTENYIKYYGIMAGVLNNRIYTAFKDSTKSDLTNFYLRDNTNINGLTDTINPGGRGELKNGILDLEDDKNNFTFLYKLGKDDPNIDNRHSKMLDHFDPNNTNFDYHDNFEFTSSGGDTNKDDYFGSDGGNVILNSFNIYEKHESKNGHIKIEYLSPNLSVLKPIKINVDDTKIKISESNIKYFSDYKESEVFYLLLLSGENNYYFTITDPSLEIDIENSYLSDSDNPSIKLPLEKLEEYVHRQTIVEFEKFTMEKLDNNKRVLSF
jgi:hypothetical protein